MKQCFPDNVKGAVLKNTIAHFHQQGVRVMLSLCQWATDSRLLDTRIMNDAAQGGADASRRAFPRSRRGCKSCRPALPIRFRELLRDLFRHQVIVGIEELHPLAAAPRARDCARHCAAVVDVAHERMRSPKPAATSAELSVEPSSTTMTSFSGHVWPSALCIALPIQRPVLKQGMPMVTSGVMRRGLVRQPSRRAHDFVKPERVKDPRAIPFAAQEIVPGLAQQRAIEMREAGGVLGEERGLDLLAQRPGEPARSGTGKPLFGRVSGSCSLRARHGAARVCRAAGRSLSARSDARGELGDPHIEQRRAQLDRGAHAHLVGLLQQRLRELPIQIEREQFAQQIALRPLNVARDFARSLLQEAAVAPA